MSKLGFEFPIRLTVNLSLRHIRSRRFFFFSLHHQLSHGLRPKQSVCPEVLLSNFLRSGTYSWGNISIPRFPKFRDDTLHIKTYSTSTLNELSVSNENDILHQSPRKYNRAEESLFLEYSSKLWASFDMACLIPKVECFVSLDLVITKIVLCISRLRGIFVIWRLSNFEAPVVRAFCSHKIVNISL